MTQQPHLSQGLELSDAAFNALWEKFRDRFPVDSRPEVGRAFAEAVADVLTPTAAPLLNREPVFFRYRHSEQEKWHYGPVALNWWECQPLFAPSEMSENAEEKNALFADGQNSTSLASSTRPHDRGPICFLPRKDLLYEFVLHDGTSLVLRYGGRGGPNQRQIWYEPETGATLDPLPPYTDVQFLGVPLKQK